MGLTEVGLTEVGLTEVGLTGASLTEVGLTGVGLTGISQIQHKDLDCRHSLPIFLVDWGNCVMMILTENVLHHHLWLDLLLLVIIVLLVPLTRLLWRMMNWGPSSSFGKRILLPWRKMNWRSSSSGKRKVTGLSSWKKMVTAELEMLTVRLEGLAEWKPELLNLRE
ncbi:hypothetical protein ACLB2K_059079 [Fragaria x ananassa]